MVHEVDIATAKVAVRKVRRELGRRLPLYFNRHVMAGWITAPHHALMAEMLAAVADGRISRLMISMPPRHGKSEMSSVLFPAFWLGRNPDKQIIHISYAASLSNEFSRKVRAIVRDSVEYRQLFPHVQLDPERQRIDDWKTAAGGGFKSIGVQGGITGHGADLMIIDDPVKEGDEQSPTTLQAIFDWYLSAARTRLHPGAAVVIVMTRWHPRDLVGRLLDLAEHDAYADQWETLVLPGLAESEDDPLGREIGDALWPDRVDREDLLAMRALSERYFNALYQQRPEISAAVMFRESDFHRADTSPEKPCVWTFDLAISEKTRSDYTVAARWYLTSDRDALFLVTGDRRRAEWPEIKRYICELHDKYPDDTFVFPKQTFELMAVQALRQERPTMRIIEIALPGDKVSRAQPFADYALGNKVVVCTGQFGDYFIREHGLFPDSGEHDDCVDVSSVATHHFGMHRKFDWLVGREHDVSDAVPSPVS